MDPGSGAGVTVMVCLHGPFEMSSRALCMSSQPRCMSSRPPSRDPCLQVLFAMAKAWTPHPVRGDIKRVRGDKCASRVMRVDPGSGAGVTVVVCPPGLSEMSSRPLTCHPGPPNVTPDSIRGPSPSPTPAKPTPHKGVGFFVVACPLAFC